MRAFKKGSTDVSVLVFIKNSTSNVGLDGLVYNSTGLDCYYCRPGSAAAQISLATQTVTGSHSDGGFVEIDATNMQGVYRLDLPDAVLASGVDDVYIFLQGAENMIPCPLRIRLTDVDFDDGVRAGMTALPNAAADGAGGLPISDAGGLDMDALATALSSLATQIGTAGDGLTAVPWNASWDTEVQSECEDAIDGKFNLAAGIVQSNLIQIASSATVDGVSLSDMFTNMISALWGDVSRSGNTYTYLKQNGSTTAFSFTVSTGGRS